MAPTTQDKHKSNSAAKPFTPTLSSNFRTIKGPLTPKLAGSKPSSPASSPPRRATRPEPQGAIVARKEEVRSPTASNLSNNVTPRSGARSSRVGGASPSTPASSNDTPSKIRPTSTVESVRSGRKTPTPAAPSKLSIYQRKQTSPKSTSGLPVGRKGFGASKRRSSTGTQLNIAVKTSPRLFNAGDAHSSVSQKEDGSEPAREDNFFYASEARRTNSPELMLNPPKLSPREGGGGKFFYANEEQSRQPPASLNTRIANFRAGSPSIVPARSPPVVSPPDRAPVHRPSAPNKSASFRSAPATSTSIQSKTMNVSTASTSSNPNRSCTPTSPPRRISIGDETPTIRNTGKRKVSNASSIPLISPKREGLTRQLSGKVKHPSSTIEAPLSPSQRFSPRSTSIGSSISGPSSAPDPITPLTKSPPRPRIDTIQQQNSLERSNELAANARRERKVLDLEISNSSLLAINRTLEREMRKQSAELRRFRRLSRSGRLSLATTSLRSTSGLSTLAEGDDSYDLGLNLSDLEEEPSSSDSDSSDNDEADSSFDDGASSLLSSTSPPTDSSHTLHLHHRERDEKRLMLDLRKHQQLLIDSQKMNLSIKRCLGWTEELIAEGQKALDYSVKVSDVKLGGKVLAHDDDDDDEEEENSPREEPGGKALLSPSLGFADLSLSQEPALEQARDPWRQSLDQLERDVDELSDSSFKARARRLGMSIPDAWG